VRRGKKVVEQGPCYAEAGKDPKAGDGLLRNRQCRLLNRQRPAAQPADACCSSGRCLLLIRQMPAAHPAEACCSSGKCLLLIRQRKLEVERVSSPAPAASVEEVDPLLREKNPRLKIEREILKK
jgi:hypothetical protein